MREITLKMSLGLAVTMVLGLGLIDTPVQSQTTVRETYPAPSHPKMKAPGSVEDIMPYARDFARNESGFLGYGFGEVKAGEKVILVVTTTDPEAEIYIEAILRALNEREVLPILMRDYEIVGVTLDEARELERALVSLGRSTDSSQGWTEGCRFFGMNDFLEKARPDLYEKCNPPDLENQLSPALFEVYEKMANKRDSVPVYLNKYLDEHSDIRGVFYDRGGPTWQKFHPNDRWLGMFVFDNMWIAMSPSSDFPADVWMQSEELTMEPASATDKVTVTNPIGLDVWWELTEDQAQRWVQGMYLRGHLFMFPNEAYGSYGLSTTRYPARPTDWIPVNPIVRLNGSVVGHTSHAGFYPSIEEIWKDGYLQEVRGGGIYGELLRTLMKMPGIHETTWPNYDEPGLFWHFETAMGTNPKALRPDITRSRVSGERERDGILHWGLGIEYWHDPGVPGVPAKSREEFVKEYKLPAGHGIHIHTYMNTMKLHIRDSDRWVTVIDKGRSTSLDSPEVRVLASRYGDPDEVLATEWVPDIPGVNAPGNYEAFAQNPYEHYKVVMEQIKAGTYNKYNPYVRPPN